MTNSASQGRWESKGKNVDEYLERVPEPVRSTLGRLREIIRGCLPEEAIETISYRMPIFKYKGQLVGFASFKNHCSLFVMSPAVMEAYSAELRDFQTSKGTIRFPVDKPPPAALVRKLVKARIAENESRTKG